MNVTLDELKRIYKRTENGTWFIPQCDCKGGNPLNTCNSVCRINVVYHKVMHLRKSIDEPDNIEKLLTMVNELIIDDVLCPICMERMPFFAGCPRTSPSCNISICIECAKKTTKCYICAAPYPMYMMKIIQYTNPENTIIA